MSELLTIQEQRALLKEINHKNNFDDLDFETRLQTYLQEGNVKAEFMQFRKKDYYLLYKNGRVTKCNKRYPRKFIRTYDNKPIPKLREVI